MAHNRRNGGGYRMEGRDNNADMEEIKRMISQLAARVARIETQSQDSDGGSFDGERDVNPFGNDGGNSRWGFDMKVDIHEFEGRMRPDDFVNWLNQLSESSNTRKFQGSRSVDEFTEEFDLLTMRCGLAEEEEQTVARYLAGLRREIHDIVVLEPCWSYSEVYQLAIQVEKQL
ncbi:hypothetical protein ACLB2K_052738 [Fragaria x ananassa]